MTINTRWFENEDKTSRRWLVKLTLALVVLQQVLLVAVGAVVLLFEHQAVRWHTLLVTNMTQWDGGWFLEIARHGYQNVAQTAFFPLYPWLISALHTVFRLPDPVAGLVLSFICFVFGLYLVGVWAAREFGVRTASLTMMLLALFPTAFFFRAVYSESLFLLLSAVVILASRRRQFGAAAVAVALAALTRNTGIVLGLILLCDYLAARGMSAKFWRTEWWRRLNLQVLWLLLPIATLASYLLWLRQHTGLPLAFTVAEKTWHRSFMPFWETLWRAVVQLLAPEPWSQVPYHAFELASWLIILTAVAVGFRFARSSLHHSGQVLYLTVILWITSSAPAAPAAHGQAWDYLLSTPRFVIVLIPVFAYLAQTLRSRASAAVAVSVCGLLLVATYASFCTGSFIA
ncbi:mannosyltransferase family protein [Alicyclobacillus sp. ALC3]|uniref:mannosyltransferase family protein n=1 Tax=Alicyclobacillus sp. ALC3 TaxID=2796143 RepID=UPI00237932CD|nr:mannosyltransferase family protein [Alicyclobacillus sp. ALC3]WDL98028.1 hypothetical protein JC200_04795 [Alicyclobacillus sp. ALC3]